MLKLFRFRASFSTETLSSNQSKEAVVWFENVLPLKTKIYDPRRFWMANASKKLLESEWKDLLPPNIDINVIKKEPNYKEGGLFLSFTSQEPVENVVSAIQNHLDKNDVRSHFNFRRSRAYFVKGHPVRLQIDAKVGRGPHFASSFG